jgi:hypothetical protein
MPENEWHIAEYVISYYPFGQPLSTPADRRRLSDAHALLRLDDWVRFQEQALLDMYWKMGDRLGFGIVPIRSPPKSFDQIRGRLAEAINHGELVVYARELPTLRRTAPPIPPLAPALVSVSPSKVQDWRIECAHHAEKGTRAVIERGTHIEIVPSKGKLVDVVKFHVRDDENGMPQSLNTDSVNVPKVGMSGHYAVYALQARYKGGTGDRSFPLSSFWDALGEVTTYRVRGAPSTIQVDVYNPSQYKFEISAPPFSRYKTGSKLSKMDKAGKDIEVKEAALVKSDHAVRWTVREKSGWSRSNLELTKKKTATRAGDTAPTATSEQTLAAESESVVFSIDGVKVKIDAVQVLKGLKKIRDDVTKIIQTIEDSVPNVGWYADFDLQFLHGSLAAEWYWREHTDHRVFQYIDVNAEMKLISAELELGIGLKALMFRAQAFVKLGGSVSLFAGAKRDGPETPALSVDFGGRIAGAVGVRFEVGAYIQPQLKGESALVIKGRLNLATGQSQPWSIGYDIDWTGVKVTAEVQMASESRDGMFDEPWEWELATPTKLGQWQWPAAQPPSSPNWVSRDRIQQVLLNVITKGFDLEVVKRLPDVQVLGVMARQEVTLDPKVVASEMADEIDKHQTFDRSEKAVQGLAHAIRQDLEKMGYRGGLHPCVEESKYQAYLKGKGLKDRLDAMVFAAPNASGQAKVI